MREWVNRYTKADLERIQGNGKDMSWNKIDFDQQGEGFGFMKGEFMRYFVRTVNPKFTTGFSSVLWRPKPCDFQMEIRPECIKEVVEDTELIRKLEDVIAKRTLSGDLRFDSHAIYLEKRTIIETTPAVHAMEVNMRLIEKFQDNT